MVNSKNFGDFLSQEYLLRRDRNPRYSYRAFARDTGLSLSHLSGIFHHKNGVSSKMANTLAASLKLSDAELAYLWNLIQRDFSKSSAVRERAESRLVETNRKREAFFLKPIDLAKAPSWKELAVLELVRSQFLGLEQEEVASRLGISKDDLVETLTNLVELNVIAMTEDGPKVLHPLVSFEDDRTTWAKEIHRNFIQKSLYSLDEKQNGKLHFSTNLTSISIDRVEEAIERLKGLIHNFNEEFGNSADSDKIYVMSLQFFDLLL